MIPTTAHVPPLEQRGMKAASGSVLLIGVLAIAVFVIVGIVVAVSAREGGGSDDAMFVLPISGGDWQLTNEAVIQLDGEVPATSERFITLGRLYGIVDGAGFVDLRSEVIYADSPLPGARWDELDTPWGDAYRRADDTVTVARQEFDDRWTVVSSLSNLSHVYDLLGTSLTRPDAQFGTPDVGRSFTYDLTLITAFLPPDETDQTVTAFDMTAADGTTYNVQVTPSASPLFDAVTYAERVEPVDINGEPGWFITNQDSDDTNTTVTWSADNNHVVTVRSTAPPDATVAAARLLKPVSRDEWTTAVADSEID